MVGVTYPNKFCARGILPVHRLDGIGDRGVRHIVKGVNGPLLEALAEKAVYADKSVINLFTHGAPVVGELHRRVALHPLHSNNIYFHVAIFHQPAKFAVLIRVSARSGIGVPIKPDAEMSVKELRAARLKKNKTLIAALKEDPYSRELLESCRDDATKGRMAPLRLAHECDLSSMNLSPRFAVKQGTSL